MYLEIILSDYVYYMPNTVWYKFNIDEKNDKNYEENLKSIIWKIVKIPFWKKEKFWLVVNTSKTPLDQNWKILDEKKIKKILKILPENFSLDKKILKIIFKISKYYFSNLQQSASLFLPKKIFSPTENELKNFLNEEKNFLEWEKILEKIFWEIKNLEEKNKVKILKKNLEEIKKLKKECKKIKKTLELKKFLEKNNLNNFENYFNQKNFLKLNPGQEKIFNSIQKNQKNFIHWITWSWKTEIYKHSVREILKNWKQACLLLPEIALTPQFLKTFEDSFDKRIIWVIHSKISPVKKAEIWHWVKSWKIKLIIWSRSALFLPWQDLWIICLDEAHEWTFKNNSSPNYRTQKVAEFYSEIFWTKLIFWTATPDISDYFEFQKNWFQIHELNKRANWKPLPKMEIVDLRVEFASRNYSYISKKLEIEIKNSLNKNEQTILFLNQRWMHSSISCLECWNPVKCKSCEVSMTFHKKWENQKLICHYCWKIENIWACKNTVDWKICWWKNFKQIWIWTQKIAENVKKLFPNAKIKIADADNVKSKKDYDNLFQELKSWEIDILIWTQIITKWLDVENISLIWVILADMSLNIPDFKSEERTFQLLVQIAWRAWRWEKNAQVIIQTFKEDHELIEIAKNYDFKKLYSKELETREILQLPPFCEILKISLRDKNLKNLQSRVKNIFENLKNINTKNNFNFRINSAPAIIPKIKNEYIWNIIIRWKDLENFMEKAKNLKNLDNKNIFTDCRIDRNPNNLS